MTRDDMVVESIFYIGRLIRPAVESAEICVILRKEEFRLDSVYLRVDLKVVRRANGRRGW